MPQSKMFKEIDTRERFVANKASDCSIYDNLRLTKMELRNNENTPVTKRNS